MDIKVPDFTKLTWQLNIALISAIFSIFCLIYNDKYIYYGFFTFLYGVIGASLLPAVEQAFPNEKYKNYLIVQSLLTVIWISVLLSSFFTKQNLRLNITMDLLFFIPGIGLSFFYGLSSYRVFTYPHTDNVYKNNNLNKFDVTKRARFHEGWTHFICSVVGWIFLYILYKNLATTGIGNINVQTISFNHFLLLLLGLLGVVGFLPLTLWGIANAIQFLVKEVTGRISSNIK